MHEDQNNNDNKVRYLNVGDSCILMMLGNKISKAMHQCVKSCYYYLNNHKVTGILEVVPAYCSIAIYYDPLMITQHEVVKWLRKCENKSHIKTENEKVRRLHIPVCFEGQFGPDLKRVAEFNGISEEKVVEIFCAHDYLNYFIGFMPGKPYLGGLPNVLETPRLDIPRFRLPSGTVAIYGKQVAIFGIQQPSGANCIGRSPILIYDTRKKDPILLRMGDMLRFFPISQEEFQEISQEVEAMEYKVLIEFMEEDR
jgi:KipI family sensor histidine kinase inhibitor